jgi:hypothetical protein
MQNYYIHKTFDKNFYNRIFNNKKSLFDNILNTWMLKIKDDFIMYNLTTLNC